MKVLTWNIWQYTVPWGYDRPRGIVPDYPLAAPRPSAWAVWELRRAALLAALEAAQPDVIVLQECAADADVAPGMPNQALQLAAVLDYQVVYQAASVSRRRAAEHGQAVLAAPGWTITGQAVCDLPSAGWLAKDATRNALCVDLAGPAGRVRVINAHLSLDGAARARSVAQLLAWAPPLPGTPDTVLLAGDLNEVPGGAPLAPLRVAGWRDCWAAIHPMDLGLTFATPAPFIRLDYIFQHPAGCFVPVAAQRLGLAPDAAGFYPSDHAGLLVTLEPGP